MHPLFSLSKHGYTCIYLPLTTDITIYVDVELDPDPLIAQCSAHYLSLSQADCARIKRYDNTNLNTRTCNYEMDFTILNERCTVSKTKRKQRKFTTINTEKG